MTEEQEKSLVALFRAGEWADAMGVELVRANAESVELRMPVGPQHMQPFGLVHGGVYCGLVETAASIAGGLHVGAGRAVVGMENQTSFLRPVRDGVLFAKARALHLGRRSQLWEVDVTDEQQRLVATGRLRLFVSGPDAPPVG